MQAYIANLSENFSLNKISDKSYIVYFSGNDFKDELFKEFKSEDLILLKDLKKDIENNIEQIDSVIFSGGEPCLQRLALLDICRFAKLKKLKTILYTNGSKPESINSLIKENLIDEINLLLNAPFNEMFEIITKSKTFFKSTEEIIEDIKKSIEIINKSETNFNIITKLNKEILLNQHIVLIGQIVSQTRAFWIFDKLSHSDKIIETIKEKCKNYNINYLN